MTPADPRGVTLRRRARKSSQLGPRASIPIESNRSPGHFQGRPRPKPNAQSHARPNVPESSWRGRRFQRCLARCTSSTSGTSAGKVDLQYLVGSFSSGGPSISNHSSGCGSARQCALAGPFGWWPKEAVKRKLVPRVGRETIRILMLSHDLKPWRGKNVSGGRSR